MEIALDVLSFAIEAGRASFIAFDFPYFAWIATCSTPPFGLWRARLLLSRHLDLDVPASSLCIESRLEDGTGGCLGAHSWL